MLKDGRIRGITGFLDQVPPGARAKGGMARA